MAITRPYTPQTWETGDLITKEKLTNIEDALEAIDSDSVHVNESQSLTTAQKAQARTNIGAQAAESGKGLSTNDYTTTEKNKLAGIAAGAEVNVNADWNAQSGDAKILNKPTTLAGYNITGEDELLTAKLDKNDYTAFIGGQTVETQYNGSNIIAENTVAGEIPDFTLYGKSTQGSTTGKNLLPNNATTQTINGVTFTVNADGSITANGTASSRAVIYLDNTALTIGSGSYMLSGTPLVDSGLYIVVYVAGAGGAERWINDIGRGKAIELSDGDSINSVYIQIEAGVTVNGQTFYPQIERGSTATAYELYTGGIPAPNPNYPMPIDTAGDAGSIPVSVEWREIPSENAGVTQNIVGLEVDYVNKTFTRLADAAGKTAGEDFNHIAPYGGRKRCNVADDGTIMAWYGDANYREDGSNGQVMVYQPKFWYKREILDKDAAIVGYNIRKERIYITDRAMSGYKLHPAFVDPNGDEVDYVMFSAYEACIYDTSASAYLMRDEQVMDVNTDKLSSIANAKPASGLTQQFTRPNVEALAQNRGANWHGDLITLESANQILAIVELGMMNGQTAIESGVSSITDNRAYNCSSLTGSTSALGNATGAATSTTNEINGTITEYDTAGKRAISYRGVENPFGNIWKFVYGINIYGNGSQGGGIPYVCTDFAFAESKNSGNYESAGFALANVNGYISAMGYGNEKFDWLFMPSEVNGNGANSTLPVGDYLYRTENLNGYRIVLMGGPWAGGANCGFFYWYCIDGVGNRYRSFSGRLAYVPTNGSAHDGNVERWMKRSGFWKSTIDIPTPNGLPGIPVSSGGNYTDDNGQMWLCDTIDKATGTYTQRVKEHTFTNGFTYYRDEANTLHRYVTNALDADAMANSSFALICNRLYAGWATDATPCCYIGSGNGRFGIMLPDNICAGTTEAVNAWLADNPVTVLYALETPVTITLTPAQIAALNAMQSHVGSTAIYTSDPVQPDMDVSILTGVSGDTGIVPAPNSANEYLGSDGAWHQPDITPTEDSTKLVTSGAVYTLKADLMSSNIANAKLHLGFYIDEDGDLCQLDDE